MHFRYNKPRTFELPEAVPLIKPSPAGPRLGALDSRQLADRYGDRSHLGGVDDQNLAPPLVGFRPFLEVK